MNRLASRTFRRLVGTLTFGLALAAVPTAASGATPQTGTSADCVTQVLSTPFVSWLDFATYTMPDDASFEGGAAGWQLDDGADVVDENEPFHVHGAGDSNALRLRAGSFAESTPICIGLGHPTLRLFARSKDSLSLSALRVDVRFRDSAGKRRSLPVGTVLPGTRWQPTLPIPVVVNLLSLLPNGPNEVTIGFTPVGSTTWWIDDLYVDPKARN
jgi:hypothetical protein